MCATLASVGPKQRFLAIQLRGALQVVQSGSCRPGGATQRTTMQSNAKQTKATRSNATQCDA
eukprot:6445698-Pyramimonas_sp.AAC.1